MEVKDLLRSGGGVAIKQSGGSDTQPLGTALVILEASGLDAVHLGCRHAGSSHIKSNSCATSNQTPAALTTVHAA